MARVGLDASPRATPTGAAAPTAALSREQKGRALPDIDRPSPRERLDAFLAELDQMSVQERIRAARVGAFTRWERSIWASRFPEQVPLVNGEFEWIALGLADLD